MNLYIDINSRMAVTGIGIASPLPAITFKDQDTPAINIYFVLEGEVQDEGSGTAIKFGLNLPPPNPISLLVYDTSFSRQIDAEGNVYYQGFPVFYTSQLAAAMGTSTSLPCVGEVRTQLSNGEIWRSMDIPFTIWRTLLLETTTPPPSIVAVYPDPSVLEIIPHKGQPSGYAGLNPSGLITSTQIPVGGDIRLTGPGGSGNIQTAYLIDILGANFTVPSVAATVTIQVQNSASFIVGQWLYIPDCGYYGVSALVDATHISITNLGSLWNEPVADTIASGLPILAACELGGTGGGGGGGANAYTATSASFTVPASGSAVTVTMLATGWMGGLGYIAFIEGAGYYQVSSIISTTQVSLTNLGYSGNAGSGTVVASGAAVSPGGLIGPAGNAGTSGSAGGNAYDATTAAFTVPAVNANVNVAMNSSAWLAAGQVLFIAGAGYYQVVSIVNPSTISAKNLGYSGNATAATVIAIGAAISPGGLQGIAGAGGSGRDAFTNLISNFTQPSVLGSVTINVGTTAWMVPSQAIYIQGGGYYGVSSVTDINHAVVINFGYTGNAAPAATVTGGSTVGVGPGGIAGTPGVGAGTTVATSFVMPTANTTVSVTLGATGWLAPGSIVFINTAGYFSVSSITDATHAVLTNLGYSANATAGTTISSGVSVVSAGAQGPAGAPGAQGAQGRDGAYATAYSGSSIIGNGGASTPFTLYNDAALATNAFAVYQRDASGNPKWAAAVLALTDAETTAGATLISASTGVVKRLVAGSNITITPDSPTVGGVTIAAAGGGGAFDPRGGFFVYEDFGYHSSTNGVPPEWNGVVGSSGNGSVSAISTYGQNNILRAQGTIELATGVNTANANNGYAFFRGNTLGSAQDGISLGYGLFDIAFRLALEEATLPGTGNTYYSRAGLWFQSAAGYPPTVGAQWNYVVCLEYSPDQNSGNFRIGYLNNSGGASALSYINCTAGPSGNTFGWWELKVDASGNVTAWLNGTQIGSGSAIAPLALPMIPFVMVNRGLSIATNWHLCLDAVFINYPYTR